ncbi:MAG TPA: universal stress protein [Gemmatimonadaceae bacterium]|nr:universal stress protein [Gemmatimonadaceae bacterium]
MYRNVMVPVDGSSFSREAVFHGLRIASRCGANLRLVRVAVSPVAVGAPQAYASENQSARQLRSDALADLYSIAVECRSHSTVNVRASLESGPIVDALVGYARRHQVDLIVMRSHARKGLARAWFGSVADQLIRESGIPVLVVRPPSIATALASGIRFSRILVPLDGSALAEQSLDSAVSLARTDCAALTLVRVVPATPRRAGVLESDIGPASADEVASARRYLDSLLTGPEHRSIPVTRKVIVAEDIPAAILHLAESAEIDLVAIATRGRNAIARAAGGSAADYLMRESTTSALVIHPVLAVVQAAAVAAASHLAVAY